MRLQSILLLTCISKFLMAQPATEIYIFDLVRSDNTYSISNPWNVTYQNPGYDNQPHFLPDGKSMYYVSTRDGQTDAAQVEFQSNTWNWLSATEGGEYSPTPMPNKEGFSAIRLDKDGTQLLYRYPVDLSESKVLVAHLKIGYHCWVNEKILAAFVLGEPSTLQICNLETNQSKIIDEKIGRSLHKIPGTEKVSYISKKVSPWMISTLDPASGDIEPVIETLAGSEDMAWTPSGDIIMGQDNKLFKFSPGVDKNWIEISDLSDHDLTGISRISISPSGDKIAVVVNQ